MNCMFCGEMTELFEGLYGDRICVVCLEQERFENEIDGCCDTGNDILGDIEQCILNGTF